MKKTFSFVVAVSFLLITGLSSCQKEETVVSKPVSNNDHLIEIAKYLSENESSDQSSYKNGNGNGALFIEPTSAGLNWILFSSSTGEIASLGALYGSNDFMRQNPDSNIAVHIVNDNAFLSYSNSNDGTSYSGIGHVNLNYSGNIISISVPFPPFELFFFAPNDARARTIHAHGDVIEDSLGISKKLDIRILGTPGGQNNSSISLK